MPRNPVTLRERSPLHGLERRTVGEADVTAHSVAVMAPSVSALGIGFMLPAVVGPGAWLSVVLGFALALAMTAVLGEFGSRMLSTGSLYTFAAKGLRAGWALAVAVSLLVAYGTLVAFGLAGTARRASLGWDRISGHAPPGWFEPLVVLAAVVLVVVVMERGIRYSTRFALFAESVSLTLLALVLLLLVLRHGLPMPSDLSLAGADPLAIVLGAFSVMTVTVGFECASALAVESNRPFLTVPRAMRRGVCVSGALILLTVVLVQGPIGRSGARGGAWFSPASDTALGDGLVTLGLTTSFVALALSAWIALSRLVFQLSREGLWGRTRRIGTTGEGHPRAAVLATLPVVLLPYLGTLLSGARAGAVTGPLLEAATVVLFVAQALTALALVRFLRNLGELTPGVHALAVGTALAFMVLGFATVLDRLRSGDLVPAVLLTVVLVAGPSWWLLLRHRTSGVRLGLHEETVRSDVLVEAPVALRGGAR